MKYRVTDSRTGKTLVLTTQREAPPTEQELQQIFNTHPATAPQPSGGKDAMARFGEMAVPFLGGLGMSAAAPGFAEAGSILGTELGGLAAPFTAGLSVPAGALLGGAVGGAIPFVAGSEGAQMLRNRIAAHLNKTPEPPLPTFSDLARSYRDAVKFGIGSGVAGRALEALPGLTRIPFSGLMKSGVMGGAGGVAAAGQKGLLPGMVAGAGLHGLTSGVEALGGFRGQIEALKQERVRQMAGHEDVGRSHLAAVDQQLQAAQTIPTVAGTRLDPKAVASSQSEIADKGLIREAHRSVLHVQDDIPEVRVQQQEEAWRPSVELANENTHRYTQQEAEDAIEARFGKEPGRAIGAKQLLLRSLKSLPSPGEEPPNELEQRALSVVPVERRAKALASMRAGRIEQLKAGEFGVSTGKERTWSAQDLMDASSGIGAEGSKAVKSGRVAPTSKDLPNIDARTVAVDLLDKFSPTASKGKFSLAKSRWADFLRDDAMHRKLFGEGQFTDAGTKFFRDAALDKLSPADRGYLDRLSTSLGYDPVGTVRPFANRVQAIPRELAVREASISHRTEELKAERQQIESETKGAFRRTAEAFDPKIKELQRRATQAKWMGRALLFYPAVRGLVQVLKKQ